MAKNKRPAEDAATLEPGNVHPSRRKRVKYSEDDAQLARIYSDLADEVQTVRIKAAGDLLKTLSHQSPDQAQRLDLALIRLIRGLCSGRKAARLGFSVALAELLRLKFSVNRGPGAEGIGLEHTIDSIITLTSPQGNISGQEKRDHALGRRFAFQAALQSDIGLDERLSDDEWRAFVKAILDLASQKAWLRRECGPMLHDYLTSPQGLKLSDTRVRLVIDELVNYKLVKTPEGVGIWITVQHGFPEVKLPKGIWHHRDPLCSKERPILAKAMLETATDDELPSRKSGSRQASPSFAWTVILSQFFKRGEAKDFGKLWESTVGTMLASTSSAERKALGLQILSNAITHAPISMLSEVFNPRSILQCILDQRAKPDRYLFDSAKVPLQHAAARTKLEPAVAGVFITALIERGAPNLDQLTKTKTLENLACEADPQTLAQAVKDISDLIFDPGVSDMSDAQNRRRGLADVLLNFVRALDRVNSLFRSQAESEIRLDSPASEVIWSLVRVGYGRQTSGVSPPITDQTRIIIRSRLMSCLGVFVDQPLERAAAASLQVVNTFSRLQDTGEKWQSSHKEASTAVEHATTIANGLGGDGRANATTKAYQLLLCLSIMQVYNDEPDSLAALRDLVDCHASREKEDSSTLLVELLLSFVSKPSALFRRLAEQVFSAFAPQLTADGLQSLTDILEQKESLRGQQELFANDEADGMGLDEAEAIDVEEESDVELVNGYEVDNSDASDGGESEASSESISEAGAGGSPTSDDEEAAFDKKLAEALGTKGLPEDSDDDGSDMDDDQMMSLEPHLASIFQERKKSTTKKQDSKDAKDNIVNFKNRVLDLLLIYVKSQHASVLTLDLVLPLIQLIRTTSSKATAEKGFAVLKQYFEACNKHKQLPSLTDVEGCFLVLAAVHDEMKEGSSKLHANACSRSGLFLSKVLVAADRELYARIASMYVEMQSEWYMKPTSKIAASVFTEWTNWSITTRKTAG